MFLSRDENKVALAKCYTNEIKKFAPTMLKAREEVYISGGLEEKCIVIKSDSDNVCEDLFSNQEEADSLVLHAIWAAKNGANQIVVQSPDTDVFVLLVHHCNQIPARGIFLPLDMKESMHV